jgi:hypothetical protein
MEDEADHHGAADPAQAFEDLRAEVSELRRAVEALPGAWEESQPPDYTPSLGTIAKGLAAVDSRLAGIEKHPALRLTPEQQQAVAQAGNMLRCARRRRSLTGRLRTPSASGTSSPA